MARGETMEAIISLSGVISPELQKAIKGAEDHLNKIGKKLKFKLQRYLPENVVVEYENKQ